MIKDVFFDLDRTLWDFERNSTSALNILFDEFNLNNYIESFEQFRVQYKLVNKRYWDDYGKGKITKDELRKGRFSDTLKVFQIENQEFGTQMNDRYIEISPYQTHLFPGAKEVLEELNNKKYHLHIITNGFLGVQQLKIEHSGLATYFETVLCSEEVGQNKPHPSVFYEALNRAHTKAADAIMIGDDFERDVIGAENVGIKGVLFDPQGNYEKNGFVNRIERLQEIPSLILGV